jgi:cytochrome c-type biogenesis protein CcmH/NrfG
MKVEEAKMSDTKATSSATKWTTLQAYTLAVVCLLAGIAMGWLFRASQSPASAAAVEAANTAAPSGMGAGTAAQPTAEQMKKMAEAQAAPLLEKLKSDPNNVDLLSNVGNVYYDTQQYPTAIGYYQQALKAQPSNAAVRTDMATAYWYTGDADTAIAEFNKALSYEPNKANALFNLGVVQWQGKMDVPKAVATWEKLLATNPTYEAKDKVEMMIAQAKKHSNLKPGTQAKPLNE